MIDHVHADFIQFDTIIHGDPEPYTHKAKEVKIKGRGGTCFEPVIKMVD